STTAHAAAPAIQNIPRELNGDGTLEKSPAGIASITAIRRASFQSTLLASRTASSQRTGWACPGAAPAEYTSCGKPQAGQ
ncbi:MAG: hypothetical protein ABR898_15905, partial [Terracidiphilus sp.]